MPILELSNDLRDSWRVYSVMLAPSDAEFRSDFWLLCEAERTANDARSLKISSVTLPLETLERLISINEAAVRERAKQAVKGGIIAGDVLLIIYALDYLGQAEPSLKKGLFLASQFYKNKNYGDGGQIPKSDRWLREQWDRYISVAHFWAAWRLNDRATSRDLLFGERLPEFLAYAEFFRRFGEGFIPKRTKPPKSILDSAQTWTISNNVPLPKAETQIEFPMWLKAAIENYSAPQSLY